MIAYFAILFTIKQLNFATDKVKFMKMCTWQNHNINCCFCVSFLWVSHEVDIIDSLTYRIPFVIKSYSLPRYHTSSSTTIKFI